MKKAAERTPYDGPYPAPGTGSNTGWATGWGLAATKFRALIQRIVGRTGEPVEPVHSTGSTGSTGELVHGTGSNLGSNLLISKLSAAQPVRT